MKSEATLQRLSEQLIEFPSVDVSRKAMAEAGNALDFGSFAYHMLASDPAAPAHLYPRILKLGRATIFGNTLRRRPFAAV